MIFLTVNLVQSQEEKESKFSIIANGATGYGIIESDNEPSYNLNGSAANILINYKINKIFGIATGIGLSTLTGNGFNSIGNFYHERTSLKVPILATLDYNVSEKFSVIANFGFYTQNIIEDEYRFLNNTQKDIYDGWNFGTQIGLGFIFELLNYFSLGLNYNVQSDLSNFKTTNNQGINDQQKLKVLSSTGIIFMIEL
jgi:opacity protein-like surface antigen